MSDYFAHARKEIIPHLPPSPKRLLEIGCAAGGTIGLIKTLHPDLWAAGVEPHAASAEKARGHVDVVWHGTVEDTPWDQEIPNASLDVILCLDVLEHLVDPWSIVKRLSPLLAPGGKLIVCVPNIRNWKFVRDLFFKGDFRYRDAGLLDRTHLRFFTLATAKELTLCGGLAFECAQPAYPWRFPDMRYLLSRLSGQRLDDIMVKQWVIVAHA